MMTAEPQCTMGAWVSIVWKSLQPCWNCMIIYPDRSRDHEAARNKCAHMTDDTDLNPSTSGSDKASDLQLFNR